MRHNEEGLAFVYACVEVEQFTLITTEAECQIGLSYVEQIYRVIAHYLFSYCTDQSCLLQTNAVQTAVPFPSVQLNLCVRFLIG